MVTGTYIGVFLQPIIVVAYGFAQGSIKPRVRFHIPLTMQLHGHHVPSSCWLVQLKLSPTQGCIPQSPSCSEGSSMFEVMQKIFRQ